ncbi:Flagellin protein FlaA [hydrothermal vent metagenome]|uniref:Flagellin protein FlaA n=1 Tax=hydrothermal vent metagenome TaxID=652676 RepID=A0A3B0VL09_9ZZZZ
MNINANNLSVNNQQTSSLTSVNQSMASGQRINSTADDPSGQAIINALSAQLNAQDMGVRNANDGVSMLQTADGASDMVTQSLQRMSELSLQAINGTLNTSQRGVLNNEFQQSLQTINQIVESTRFNGQTLLNGDMSSVNIALGSESNSTLTLPTLTTDALSITGLSIADPVNASTALAGVASAIEQLGTSRAEFGAQQNSLISSIDNLQNQNIASYATKSQISDTDFAKAIAEQSRQNILNESAIAMQSQGNQSKATVLQLLN